MSWLARPTKTGSPEYLMVQDNRVLDLGIHYKRSSGKASQNQTSN